MHDDFLAGAAANNITCPLGVALAGSMRPRPCTDVHDELHAKAIVLRSGGKQAALVVCDVIALCREDLDPTSKRPGPRGPWEQLNRVARTVAAEAIKVWNGIEFSPDPPAIDGAMEWLTIGVRQPTAEQLDEARRLLTEFGDVRKRIDPQSGWTTDHAFADDRLALLEQPNEVETPVHVLRVGDLAFVGLPGEMFCQIGLDLKAQSPFDTTFVVELANDYVGYVCTAEAFEQGGYEPTLAQSSKLVPGAAARMTESATRLLEQTHEC